jgi:type V secretory pathway adhesin AidA
MLISVLIMGVLVVAAGILLFTTPGEADEGQPGPAAAELSSGPTIPSDTDINVVDGLDDNIPPPTPTPEPTPEPTPTPEVRSVRIFHSNSEMSDFTISTGERITLRVRIEPVGIEEEITWTSSNPNVFDIVPDNVEGTEATITGIGSGSATVRVTVGGRQAECIVRVRR